MWCNLLIFVKKYKDAVEVKKDLEKSLKLCKTNENFLKSENERLGKVAEEAEATRLPEKEKEISLLKKQIETVCNTIDSIIFE